jgi:hypothetical protein
MKKFLVISALAVLCPTVASADVCKTEGAYPYEYNSEYGAYTCPSDIQSWMDRVNICADVYTKIGEDWDRADEFADVIEQNQCEGIACDYHDLFAKYEGDMTYTGALYGYAERVYGGDDDFDCSGEGEIGNAPGEEYDSSPEGEVGNTPEEDAEALIKGMMGGIFK